MIWILKAWVSLCDDDDDDDTRIKFIWDVWSPYAPLFGGVLK
jgi:hypothetical protein